MLCQCSGPYYYPLLRRFLLAQTFRWHPLIIAASESSLSISNPPIFHLQQVTIPVLGQPVVTDLRGIKDLSKGPADVFGKGCHWGVRHEAIVYGPDCLLKVDTEADFHRISGSKIAACKFPCQLVLIRLHVLFDLFIQDLEHLGRSANVKVHLQQSKFVTGSQHRCFRYTAASLQMEYPAFRCQYFGTRPSYLEPDLAILDTCNSAHAVRNAVCCGSML